MSPSGSTFERTAPPVNVVFRIHTVENRHPPWERHLLDPYFGEPLDNGTFSNSLYDGNADPNLINMYYLSWNNHEAELEKDFEALPFGY